MLSRRCTSDSCQMHATNLSASHTINLPIANVLSNPKKEWQQLVYGNIRVAREIKLDWQKFNPEHYLLSHCSIVSSVNTTDNGYYIESPTDELVNNNGNAWTEPVLISTFKTFIGAENFLEHVQIAEESKGKILDAVIRPVIYKGKNGKTANVKFVDILVATNRKHNELCDKIIAGDLTTMSMGGVANVVQCSACGKELRDEENCHHLDNQLTQYFIDENGKKRIIAELCGRSSIDQKTGLRIGDPESFKFIEASWVGNPAFRGAVLNHYISDIDEEKEAIRVASMSTFKLSDLFIDLRKMKVADSYGRIVLKVACKELQNRQMINNIVKIWSK